MAFDFRPATADERDQVGLMAAYVYAGAFGDGPDNITSNSIQPDWTLCAFDGDKLITSFAAFPFTMRANGNAISFAGVTAVGTRPEYRRRGLVRKIMTQAIKDMKDRGQPISGLWASQAAIYQRYGYAVAGANRRYSIDTADVRFFDGDEGSCVLERVSVADGVEQAKGLYRQFIQDRFGYLHRSSILWRENVLDETSADGPVHIAIASDGKGPQGYVAYTLRSSKVDHRARGQEIKIRDLSWLTQDAYRSLWSFLGSHDLVGRITWENAPVDDPAPYLFSEPRLLHTEDREGSWMRIIDLPEALAQRGYLPQDRARSVTFQIEEDALAPWNEGAWRLDVDEHGQAEVTAGTSEDVLIGSIRTLTSLYTGASTALELARTGLLKGSSSAILNANAAMATYARPHCPDHY